MRVQSGILSGTQWCRRIAGLREAISAARGEIASSQTALLAMTILVLMQMGKYAAKMELECQPVTDA